VIGARVDVRTGWGAELAKEINLKVKDAVGDASKVGAEVAASAVTRRRTGKMAHIEPVEVLGTPDGWEGGFKSEAFYSGFESRGTLGSRKRSVRASTLRRRQSASGSARLSSLGGSKGITPLGHEEKGLAAAKKALVDRLNHLT
jgi:hypothetical protein